MTTEEFEKLVLFWSLKGQISHGVDMGTKGLGDARHQVKRIIVDSKDFEAIITYTVYTDDRIIIDYADIVDNYSGVSKFYGASSGLPVLEKM